MMKKEEIKQYPVATLEEYGYKSHKFLKVLFKIINYVVIISVILMMYLSVIIIAIQSVNKSTDVSTWGGFTLSWYGDIKNHSLMVSAIKNTFIISGCATLISTVLGTFIAIGINSLPNKVRSKVLLLNNIPLLNADIVTGITLMLVFSIFQFVFPYIFGFPTLLLAHMFFTLPYVILSVLPKLKEIDPNMMDAAMDLGVKPYKSLIKVIIPAIKAGIFSGLILAFTMSFDDFVISYYTTGNGFDNLSIWIYGSIGRKSLTPSVYAFNTLVIFVTMILLFIVNILRGKKGKKNAKEKN